MTNAPRSRKSPTWRKIKFTILRRAVAPLLIVFVKLLMSTWRVRVQGDQCWDEWKRGDRRCAVALFHGSFFCAISAFHHLPRHRRSRMVNMVSPSQDGRLLADIMAAFGMYSVAGSPRSRGAAGLLELIDETKNGSVAVFAVNNPRDPRGVPREGVLALAKATDARIYSFMTHGSPAIRFKSWDRAELPLPFARVDIAIECVFDLREQPLPDDALAQLQEHMLATMERLGADTGGITRLTPAKGDTC